MSATTMPLPYDLKNAVSVSRLTGLWRMMTGFRWRYLGATVTLAVGASAKTATMLLLRYFVDSVLGQNRPTGLLVTLRWASLRLPWQRAASPFSAAAWPRRPRKG